MIKCISFSKLLKLSFSILLIGFLGGFVNFSSAFDYVECVGFGGFSTDCIKVNNGESITIGSYVYTFNGDNITTNYGYGLFKGLYSKSPYYNQSIKTYYNLLDGFYNAVSDGTNYKESLAYSCISSNYNACMWSSQSFSTIYSIRSLTGYYGLPYDYVILPFSSEDDNIVDGYGICFHFPDTNSYLCFPGAFGNALGEGFFNSWNTIDSEYFNNIAGINFPFGLSSPMQGPISGGFDNNLTGDYIYSTVSYGEIWDYVENKLGYSKYLCYGGIDNFDISSGGVSPIPGTGKNIDEIQLNWSNVYNGTDFYSYRKGLYGQNYLWSSYPYVYKTWFDFYYQYGGANYEFNDVFSYCKTKYILQLNRDTIYNGNNYKGIIDNIIREKRFGLSGSGDIVGVNWNGIGNLSGGDTKNAVVYIQDFFNKLKENFPTTYDAGLGFLPQYIIIFMLALILFRFISH